MPREQNIYQCIPSDILKGITTQEDREKYVRQFLENRLPHSDLNSIPDELRKSFLFQKHKGKLNKSVKSKSLSFHATRKSILLSLNNLLSTKKLTYRDVLPLNKLWTGYMKELLGVKEFSEIKPKMNPADSNYENFTQHIMRADFHGAMITVFESKCPSFVRIKGIIIVETKNIFRIISEDNKVRSIPKEQCVFLLHLKDVSLIVEGKDICIRPAERSVKKFKGTFKL